MVKWKVCLCFIHSLCAIEIFILTTERIDLYQFLPPMTSNTLFLRIFGVNIDSKRLVEIIPNIEIKC